MSEYIPELMTFIIPIGVIFIVLLGFIAILKVWYVKVPQGWALIVNGLGGSLKVSLLAPWLQLLIRKNL